MPGFPLPGGLSAGTIGQDRTERRSTITAHTPTPGIELYPDFAVSVNGVPVPVHQHDYNVTHEFLGAGVDAQTAPFGYALCSGTAGTANVRVVVSNRGTITGARVLPSRKGIVPTITGGNTVEFTLPVSGGYIPGQHDHWRLEVQGDGTIAPCAVRTTANITLSGEKTIDGVVTNASRVLVMNQTNKVQNGVYRSAAGAWARVPEAATESQLYGMSVIVTGGTLHAGTRWVYVMAGHDGQVDFEPDIGRNNWLDITILPPPDPAPVVGAAGVHYYTPGTVTRNATATTHAFGPGVYYVGNAQGTGTFTLKDNDVIYLAPGAWVYGLFSRPLNSANTGASNIFSSVRFYGRGTISGKTLNANGLLRLFNYASVYIEGITLCAAPGWTCKNYHVRQLRIVGVTSFGSRANNDGITIASSQNAHVSHVRVNTNDDALTCKSFADKDDFEAAVTPAVLHPTPRLYTNALNNVIGVHVHDSWLRSDVGIGVIAFGYKITCEEASDWLIERLDCYNTYNRSLVSMDIQNFEGMPHCHIRNVTVRDIYSHDHVGERVNKIVHYVNMDPQVNGSNAAAPTGKITNIVLEGFYITGPTKHNVDLAGVSAACYIDGITLRDWYFNGTKLTTKAAANVEETPFVTNVVVE